MNSGTITLNEVFNVQPDGLCPLNTDTTNLFYRFKPLVEHYYPISYDYWKDDSRIEKAFKLVQKLMNKKLVKEPKTVKDFIELVNEISEVI